ncbi:thioesterase family protein [Aestuariibacter halophilus]|uniref:Thioesterase family protein n=1 Tax=Fluctibacter halophilus TaxID=226011 RepID=A0ABS8G5S4_9ALTE|nr:thioesterase family protein [Aestuariibacter halophilus]MCC2615853.1 thioesterase family protein [Aestuariibacter halophilus]
MHIDELLNYAEPGREIVVPSQWSQGRTCYGGVSAALLYRAMQSRLTGQRVMRSLNCNFIGPLLADQPFHIEVEALRQGKSASQMLARAIQNEQTAVLMQVCFGVSRDSKVQVKNTDRHGMTIPTKPKFIPQIPKVTPKFIRHFDLAIESGGLPFTGSSTANVDGWMRYSKPPQQFSDAHLVGLIDAWPPTVLQMLKWPAPASTMCWNVEFLHPHPAFSPTGWFAYQARTRQAADGYAHTEANIWDENNNLVAISRQAVAVFD